MSAEMIDMLIGVALMLVGFIWAPGFARIRLRRKEADSDVRAWAVLIRLACGAGIAIFIFEFAAELCR